MTPVDPATATLLHLQELDSVLPPAQRQLLDSYLHLPSVLEGASALLGQLFGLRLQHRAPLPGETWSPGTLVYDLLDCDELAGLVDCAELAGLSNSSRREVIGTIYIDAGRGYGTRLLHHGAWAAPPAAASTCTPSAAERTPEPATPAAAAAAEASPGTAASAAAPAAEGAPAPAAPAGSCEAGGSSRPAVAIGLQSGEQLGGEGLGLGLWEVLHELGHALHFLLSSSSSGSCSSDVGSNSSSSSGDIRPGVSSSRGDSAVAGSSGGSSGSGCQTRRLHHLQASCLPLELQELPSTLLEELCMQPATLQLLCRHRETDGQLPADLAARLAAYLRACWYHPLTFQQLLLAMMFDQEAAGWGARQGRQAAHRAWQAAAEAWSVVPGVPAGVQQVGLWCGAAGAGG